MSEVVSVEQALVNADRAAILANNPTTMSDPEVVLWQKRVSLQDFLDEDRRGDRRPRSPASINGSPSNGRKDTQPDGHQPLASDAV